MTTSNHRVHDQEVTFQGAYAARVFQSLTWAWAEFRWRLAVILLLGVVGRTLLLGTTLVFGYWADSLCQGQAACKPMPSIFAEFDSADFLTLVIILIACGVSLSTSFLGLFSATGARVAERYHNETTLRVSRAPMTFFDRNPVGRIFSRFSSDFQHIQIAMGPHLSQISAILLDLCIMSALIGFSNWLFLPLLVATVVANYVVYNINKALIRRERRDAAAQRAPSIAHFSSTVQGYLAIRVFHRAKRFSEVFRGQLRKYYHVRTRAELTFHVFGLQMSLLAALLALASGVLGLALIHFGLASIGEVGVVVTYVTLASAFIQRLFSLITSLEQGLTGAERMTQYLVMPLEPFAKLPPAARYPTPHPRIQRAETPPSLPVNASLVIENLRFRYQPSLPWIIDGLSISIEAGEAVGVIGRTGSGKSTLFQVLLNLYPHEGGRISINGAELALNDQLTPYGSTKASLTTWRSYFAYVAQDPAIFRGTVLDNLVSAEASFQETDLLSVLEKVGLGRWLDQQPAGLDTLIEEGGANLSAGQKQLLAISRCLLNSAPIVLLDEATSAIDPLSEESFVKATRELMSDRTRLIIAHRLSTIESCDRVIWLEQGRARMIGPPEMVLPAFLAEDNHLTAGIEV